MKTWQEREELVAARGAEYRAGEMTGAQFSAYLFSMRLRGEDIRHTMRDYAPVPPAKTFDERQMEASREWLRAYQAGK